MRQDEDLELEAAANTDVLVTVEPLEQLATGPAAATQAGD